MPTRTSEEIFRKRTRLPFPVVPWLKFSPRLESKCMVFGCRYAMVFLPRGFGRCSQLRHVGVNGQAINCTYTLCSIATTTTLTRVQLLVGALFPPLFCARGFRCRVQNRPFTEGSVHRPAYVRSRDSDNVPLNFAFVERPVRLGGCP